MSAVLSPATSIPPHRLAELDQGVKGVMFSFNLSDKKLVSRGLLWKRADPDPQTPRTAPDSDFPDSDSRVERNFLRSAMNISLVRFLHELRDTGFVLTSAEGRSRSPTQVRAGQVQWAKTQCRVRFIFRRAPLERPFEEQVAKYLRLHGEISLEELCERSMWSVEGFSNPLRGREGRGISFLCSNRTPLFLQPGVPSMKWQKDENGERVGDKPQPITPDAYLRLTEGKIVVD